MFLELMCYTLMLGFAGYEMHVPISPQEFFCDRGGQTSGGSKDGRFHQEISDKGVLYGFPSSPIFVFTDGPRGSNLSMCRSTMIGGSFGPSFGSRASSSCRDEMERY